jgi:hypothetical protein
MKCPKCESENTQRLEVAFRSGTQNISTSSNTAGVGIGSGGRLGFGGGVTKTSGQSQSILAQQAAPPAKKSYKWPVICVLFSGAGSLIGGTAGVVMPWIIFGISGYLIYSRFQFNSKEWPKLYQYWSESCPNDGT